MDLYLAVKALESGDKEEYKRLLDKAKTGISQSYASGERHPGTRGRTGFLWRRLSGPSGILNWKVRPTTVTIGIWGNLITWWQG